MTFTNVDPTLLSLYKTLLKESLAELRAIVVFDHLNILKVVRLSLDMGFLVITELCRTEMESFIKYRAVDYTHNLKLLIQISSGFARMHSHEILYRNLKHANLLIDFEGNIKIADFGLASRVVQSQNTSRLATSAPF